MMGLLGTEAQGDRPPSLSAGGLLKGFIIAESLIQTGLYCEDGKRLQIQSTCT